MNKIYFSRSTLLILLFTILIQYGGIAIPNSFAPLVKAERKKIVHLTVSSKVVASSRQIDPFFDRLFPDMPKERKQSALGSGFIISADGYIVTNNHVIEKADKIEVILFNEEKYEGKLIGKDSQTDLALIKIDGKNLPHVSLGDSNILNVGDWVIAIGNPLGLDHSVTAGILSAKNRDIFSGTAYGQFFQTDAAINPGNSGGPLFNMKGEVIGINTAIIAGGQGLGFAIPINLAKNVIKQLKKFGKVVRGWFGVAIQDVSIELAESYGLPKGSRGVAIAEVGKDSPAGKAGLLEDDVLLEFEGSPLSKTTELQRYVAETVPGNTIKVKVFRDGKILTLEVTVGLKPGVAKVSASTNEGIIAYGLDLKAITPKLRKDLNLGEHTGLYVNKIQQNGIAWEAGIRKGDIILKADKKKIRDVNDFSSALKESKLKKYLRLFIKRDNKALILVLKVK